MNIEIANRLQQLRKQKGYSQEQLADELGISRQAVSKWERAEASPDTDNLILLARLYGVSLDELLSTEETNEEIKEEKNEKNERDFTWEELTDGNVRSSEDGIHIEDGEDRVHIGKGGIHIESGSDSVHIDGKGIHINSDEEIDEGDILSRRDHHVVDIITGCFSLLTVIAYFLLGGIFGWWHPAWIIFLFIPIVGSLCDCVVKKNASKFAYPVFVTALYLFFGCVYGGWHPHWVMFITIPIYYMICDLFKKK